MAKVGMKALSMGKGTPDRHEQAVMNILKGMPLPKNAEEATTLLPHLEEAARILGPAAAGGGEMRNAEELMKTLTPETKGKLSWLTPKLKKYGGLAVGAMFLHYVLSSMMAQKQQKGLAQTEMQAALMGMKPEAAANEEITKMLMGDYSRNREAYLAALSPNYPQVASGESAALGSLVRRISRTKTAIGGSAGAGTGGLSPEELMAALSSGR